MNRFPLVVAALLAAATVSSQAQQIPDPRIADLVQAGKIRTALFLPQYTKDSATGEIRGLGMGIIALEVARALAARLSVQMLVMEQPTPPKAVECLKTSACDVMFLGIEPSRLTEVDFTPSIAHGGKARVLKHSYVYASGMTPPRTPAAEDRCASHADDFRPHGLALGQSLSSCWTTSATSC